MARSSRRTWGSTCSRLTGSCSGRFNPPAARHFNINPLYLETIRAGLRAAASQPGGTSADVFQNFPEQVYGKTGTAQYNGQQDYAWYACFVPSSATTKPIVVVVTVEQGGFGAVGAAPVARQILSQWFFGNKGQYVAGNSQHTVSVGATPIRPVEDVAAPRERMLLRMDPLLLLAALGLGACSLLTLKGATRTLNPGHPLYYVERQGIYFGLGLAVALLLARLDYTRLREYKYGLYGVMIALNLVVLGMPKVQGAARWIPLPFFQLQPSEFGKVLLVVAVSAFAVDRSRRLHERRTTARIMLLAIIPALLVIPQPDLGTALVYIAVGFAILFFVGTSWKQLTALVVLFVLAIVVVLVVAPATGHHVLKPYQMQRLTGFLHPSHDPRNQTYNILQSLTAIGSGGKTGLGTAGATQVNLGYLPAPNTDFIFAVVGETYGFVGAAIVLSLYALLIWRALRILTMAKNLYGTLIAGGLLAMLMFQVFINAGMTIGIMPITGVPLPLMSYGGSSVLVTFIAIGLLQSIYIQARMTAASKSRGLVSQ